MPVKGQPSRAVLNVLISEGNNSIREMRLYTEIFLHIYPNRFVVR